MGDLIELAQEAVPLEKFRKHWQDAKAMINNSKNPGVRDLLKAFKGDLGPCLDALAAASEKADKAAEAMTAADEKAGRAAIQTLAG